MTTFGQIHWHEGLFLQPHHLQALQREIVEGGARERRLAWAYPYGVIESRISTDALENLLVRIDRLRAVMPSGVEIDVPGNTDVPALDIKRVFQGSSGSFTVSLAVPLYQPGRPNQVALSSGGAGAGEVRRAVAEDVRVKRLFRVAEVSRVDENTGENSQPMLVRRLNARLVVDGDDVSDMETIPLVRIMHSAEESSLPRPDPNFVPPCLTLSGSPKLRNLVRDLGTAVETARKDLISQMTRAGFAVENLRGPQILQLIRLQTLNKYAARIPSLVSAGLAGAGGSTFPTFDAYMELRELLAELAGLTPERDPWEAPRYDHDNPGVSFLELDRKLRPMLQGNVERKFLKAAFVSDGGVLACTLTDEHLSKPNGYYLGVKTKMDATQLSKLLEDQDRFKLMPRSMVKLNIYGLKLAEERHFPNELPASSDLLYFRVDLGASEKMWERAKGEKALAIRWPEAETFEFQEVALYMTVP
jgi:type VI secretion system protein ImpJ